MGITRDNRAKRRATGGKKKHFRNSRKLERGHQPTLTRLGERKTTLVRMRGGDKKIRAIRLDSGNFGWGTEAIARKSRILRVTYNATSNELVRTNTLVKNSIIQIDATPFRQWYEQHYGVQLGKIKRPDAAKDAKEASKADKAKALLKKRLSIRKRKDLERALGRKERVADRIARAAIRKAKLDRTIAALRAGEEHPKDKKRREKAAAKEAAKAADIEAYKAAKRLKAAARKDREKKEKPPGDKPAGDKPAGDKPVREKKEKPAGDKPVGEKKERPAREKKAEKSAAGAKPEKPVGDKPEKPAGDKPKKPAGAKVKKPAGDKPKKPAAEKPEKPTGDKAKKPAGEKPAGKKPAGEKRPVREKRERPDGEKTEGDSEKKHKRPRTRNMSAKRQSRALKERVAPLDTHLADQFLQGRLYACIASRPGQDGFADGYILEGKELEFYLKKMAKKKN